MGGKRCFMFKDWLLCCFVMALVLSPLCLSGHVFAQEDSGEEEAFTLEAITVTAEKREAELQKIPLDISVVRTEDMSRLGVQTIERLDELLPDIQTSQSAGSYAVVKIREVRSNFWNPIHETTVAMHMDGIQLTRVNGFNNMFYDLQRMEVLKGPQGTLYGRGSTAGTMNFISQKPILDDLGGYVTVEAGNFSLYRTEGALNIPVAEKLAFRVAGRTYRHEGYNDSGWGDQDAWSGRVSMNWEPTDKDQFTLVWDQESSENNGSSGTGHVFGTYGDLTIVPNTYNPSLADLAVAQIGPTTEIKLPWQSKWLTTDTLNMNFNDLTSWGFMAQYDRELPFAYLTVLYGHRALHERKQYVGVMPGFTFAYLGETIPNIDDTKSYQDTIMLNPHPYGPPSVWTYGATNSKTDSFEARLLSKATITMGDRYEWVAGYMYQDDDLWESDVGIFNPMKVNINTKISALFGQAAFQIVDKLTLTGGYRYSWDEKIFDGRAGTMFAPDYNNPLSPGWRDIDSGFKLDYDTYKINLSYSPTEAIMGYVQYALGIKTGNMDYQGHVIPPEKLASFEAGFKSRFLDNRLQLNLTAYYYDYKNYNDWGSVSKCRAYRVYDDNGNPITGESVASIDPVAQNTTDVALLHECFNGWRAPLDETDEEGAQAIDWDAYAADLADNGVIDDEANDPGDYDVYDDEYNYSAAVSAGGSEQVGVNLNIIYLLTSKDTFNISATYSSNKYTDYDMAAAMLVAYSNADSPYRDNTTPETGRKFGGAPIRGNISYNRSMFLFGMDMLNFNLRAQYEGKGIDKYVNDGSSNPYTMPGRDEYWLMSTSITYSSSRWVPEGTSWIASFWCNNLFDSQHFDSINYAGSYSYRTSATIDPYSGTYGGSFVEPRIFGASITFNF